MTFPDTVRVSDPVAARAGAFLTIDLNAITANYRLLCARASGCDCAAVVKADAYGLGANPVASALARAGARTFFVALADEGVALRGALGEVRPNARIFVLDGLLLGTEPDLIAHRLEPVLNSLGEIEAWHRLAVDSDSPLSAALHVDTGMNRLGLPKAELETLLAEPNRLDGIRISYVMSHLACAEEPRHAKNAQQLALFRDTLARLRDAPASLANSSGIFLGPDYHFGMVRPGAAIYGINPTPQRPNPMRQVVSLQAKVLQVRDVDAHETVGYGATHRVAGPSRIATVAAGYADGLLRALSNSGRALIGEMWVPVVGRVSMDLLTLDATGVPPTALQPGSLVELLGPRHTPDDLAAEAGTIGYEILTALGRRYARCYTAG